jgi:F-type H+-transporting ATPase subunit epsilon
MAHSSNNLKCVVVTPEMAVLDESADFVAVPMYDGELGVLPGRSPLIGRLGVGELRIKNGNNVKRVFVDGGFVQIRSDVVTLLTDKAQDLANIDVAAAQRELEAALAKPTRNVHEQADATKAQAAARAKLRMVSK